MSVSMNEITCWMMLCLHRKSIAMDFHYFVFIGFSHSLSIFQFSFSMIRFFKFIWILSQIRICLCVFPVKWWGKWSKIFFLRKRWKITWNSYKLPEMIAFCMHNFQMQCVIIFNVLERKRGKNRKQIEIVEKQTT